jgi:hypothetical protein
LRVVSGEWKKLQDEQVKQDFREVCPKVLHHLAVEQTQSVTMPGSALNGELLLFRRT